MRQELEERSRAQARAEASSIGAELAHLEQRLGKRSSLTPDPGAAVPSGPRAQEVLDRNADGRPDLWAYYDGDRRMREVLDDNHDGRADRILHYENGSTLTR